MQRIFAKPYVKPVSMAMLPWVMVAIVAWVLMIQNLQHGFWYTDHSHTKHDIASITPLSSSSVPDGGQSSLNSLLITEQAQLKQWFAAAQQGQPEAQFKLASIYWSGTAAVNKDRSLALVWFKKSAQAGYQPASEQLRRQGIYN